MLVKETFMVKEVSTDDCWLYAKPDNNLGYGKFEVDGVHYRAHRVMYEAYKGEIPKGLHIDHLCRVPPCINPDHLEAVTPRENILRGISPVAINAKKTHCIHGHKFNKQNTSFIWSGRRCKECNRLVQQRHRDRIKLIKLTSRY